MDRFSRRATGIAAGALAGIGVVLASSAGYQAWAAYSTAESARKTIAEAEKAWAASVLTGDTSVVERILADDFVGTDDGGNRYDKKAMIEAIRTAPQEYTGMQFAPVEVRVFGTVAVAQGGESWTRRTLAPTHGRFVFNDTWVLRDGRWLALSGTYFMPPSPPVELGQNAAP